MSLVIPKITNRWAEFWVIWMLEILNWFCKVLQHLLKYNKKISNRISVYTFTFKSLWQCLVEVKLWTKSFAGCYTVVNANSLNALFKRLFKALMSKSFDLCFYGQLWMVTIINCCINHSEYLFINKVQCKIFSFLQSFSWGNSNFEKHYNHSTKTIWPLLCFPIRYYWLIVMKRICLVFFSFAICLRK